MFFYIFLTFGFIFAIFFLMCLIYSITEKDFETLPCAFISLFFTVTFIGVSILLKEKVGTVCSVEKVQTSYIQTIKDGEIEQVPSYSYLILFQTESGEYRTFTTTNVNYGILKERDPITYTLDGTEKIKEE